MPILEEIFKPIPGFPDYEVSNTGKVKSLKSLPEGRIIKPLIDKKGYRRVGIKCEGNGYIKTVHQLVMLAFVGPRPEGMVICHQDGNPGNNHLNNLRYDTHLANMNDNCAYSIPKTRHYKEGTTYAKLCYETMLTANPAYLERIKEFILRGGRAESLIKTIGAEFGNEGAIVKLTIGTIRYLDPKAVINIIPSTSRHRNRQLPPRQKRVRVKRQYQDDSAIQAEQQAHYEQLVRDNPQLVETIKAFLSKGGSIKRIKQLFVETFGWDSSLALLATNAVHYLKAQQDVSQLRKIVAGQ